MAFLGTTIGLVVYGVACILIGALCNKQVKYLPTLLGKLVGMKAEPPKVKKK